MNYQAQGLAGYSDAEIRTDIVCLFVAARRSRRWCAAGDEQLLRRPDELKGAQAAAGRRRRAAAPLRYRGDAVRSARATACPAWSPRTRHRARHAPGARGVQR